MVLVYQYAVLITCNFTCILNLAIDVFLESKYKGTIIYRQNMLRVPIIIMITLFRNCVNDDVLEDAGYKFNYVIQYLI